jgi:pimeloyl-ACP methyl ester carboxylesterase
MPLQDFIPHHSLVAAPGAQPSRWMLVLHGVFGSGNNFRALARRLTQACPTWGMILVDLRAHGLSQGAPPPHSVAAAAADVLRLEQHLDLEVRGIMSHSFGGKVSLAYLAQRAELARGPVGSAKRLAELEQVWILDAAPGARAPGRRSEGEDVLELLESLPARLPSREWFLQRVMQQGHSRAMAEWLAMNVRRAPAAEGLPGEGFYQLRLDLQAIRAMLEDYFGLDLWPVLEHQGFAQEIHMVIGGQSGVWDAQDRARLEALARSGTVVYVHILEGAGHLVHVDDPDGLFGAMRQALCR